MSATPDPSASLARAYPTGTVAFAFTDIEGSTQRWERDRSAMQEAVRRHDAPMRAAIEAHGGHVFKTIGDAFCAAFARPQDAVAAMLAAQQTLTAQDFSAVDGMRVRAAIHVGTADERGGDYFGPTVNRVARLLAIGHGGQVLLSGVAADLAVGTLPERATLLDLGSRRLKDSAQPEQVYQLLAPDLRTQFPPLLRASCFVLRASCFVPTTLMWWRKSAAGSNTIEKPMKWLSARMQMPATPPASGSSCDSTTVCAQTRRRGNSA